VRLTPLEPWIAGKIGAAGRALTREALAAYQLEKLRETLALVRARSQFYRRRLARAPERLDSLEDLAAYPFTTADDLRGGPLQLLCVSQGDIQRVVTLDTSGTSGDPKRLYFTLEDQELTIDFFRAGMSTLVDPGDRVLILLPGERAGSVGDLLKTGLERLGAVGIKHGLVRDTREALEALRRERADALVGVPVQALGLARQPQTGGAPPRLKSVLLSTDHVPAAIAQVLEATWGCAVYNHYGMTEMGLGGGVECQARRGYHLREADLYVEIVDPLSGIQLPDGQYGEVVFTTLTRRGMPLLRYRTGDVSRFIPGPCPCGSFLKTLEPIRCRKDGIVTLGAARFMLADLDEALFPLDGLLDFSAAALQDASALALHITLWWNRATLEGCAAEAAHALDRVAPLRAARRSGALRLTTEHKTVATGTLLPPGKRTIYIDSMR
jgi:phenylacetate-coenzyme A ligase PaaK-like adenylate-forming protein